MNEPLEILNPKASESAIEHLEKVLKDAKEGKLRSIAYACVYAGGASSNGWSKEDRAGPALLTEVGILKARIENNILRGYYPDEMSR